MTYGRRKCECGHKYISTLTHCPKCNAPDWVSDFIPFNALDWIYDIETYPNIFTCAFMHPNTGTRLLFEISDRYDQTNELVSFLNALKDTSCRMIGFNNIGFDYPVIHYIMEYVNFSNVDSIYNKASRIIHTPWERRFDNLIWDNEILIKQIDLYKIHHFDNESRRTSLKLLEFNMAMDSIDDLPHPPGTKLSNEKKSELIKYNHHDVDATLLFYAHTIDMIEFREQLSEKYNHNFLNHNDTKIGKDYFIMKLEDNLPGVCYSYETGSKKPRQTIRPYIDLGDVIFPYIKFEQPEFERIRKWLSSQKIKETKGIFTDLTATINDFEFDFGVGGIHGSVKPCIVQSDDEGTVIDVDVASYYPNLAIVNRLYPQHLSEEFCNIYKDVYEMRKQYPKGTAENAMLKLALNGVYGDSNNKYSPFYDPQFTMSITINGQLLLCLLAENLMRIPGLKMVQINTDGLTVKCPNQYMGVMNELCSWWESFTQLTLESNNYSRMFIRDVNNYIAEYMDSGKLKRKGAYCYGDDLDWHQNYSSQVVAKAAEAALVHGTDIEHFIHNHKADHDFMLRSKVNRTDHLMYGDTRVQRISRYYIANDGFPLIKVAPPKAGCHVGQWKRANGLSDSEYTAILNELGDRTGVIDDVDVLGKPWDERINTKNRSKYEKRETQFHVGYLVSVCNDISLFNRSNINYQYYITATKKLVEPLL